VPASRISASSGSLGDTDRYFDALTAYRLGAPEEIVDRFADAAFIATATGRTLVSDFREVRREWQSRVIARRDGATWRVADLLLREPVINASLVTAELQIAPQDVYRTLDPLLEAGVLVA